MSNVYGPPEGRGAGPSSRISARGVSALDAYWRATNYLGAAQLYLQANPLLKEPLASEHIKERLLGHWGTQPGLNIVYAHLNRLIKDTGDNIMLVVGPGHGAPAILANLWLEGSLFSHDPAYSLDMAGLRYLVRDFSWPRGAPSHLYPGTPGSIQEGGELGYALFHAFGAAFDNPDLIVACIIGDGEAETGPLSASWQSNKFLNPTRDGAVLPILHLNEYKIAGPTVLGRMSDHEIGSLFTGHGYEVRIISGDDADFVHRSLWDTFDWAEEEIREIQEEAHAGHLSSKPAWPMIVLRTPKGWTGPEQYQGKTIEGSFHSHQIPIPDPRASAEDREALEAWLRSYDPESLFDEDGRPAPEVLAQAPEGDLRMGMNPHADGGRLLSPLRLPDYKDYAVEVEGPGASRAEATARLAEYVRDVFRLNEESNNFRFFCPDEITSNRMQAIFEATDRVFVWPTDTTDEHISPSGRVMEVLSEHACQGWLEGYLLSGRHGMFACYEAFIPIVDSMLNQYAKWLKVSHEIPWRKTTASLNYLLTSHVWRQDHNGYSHQVPSFINNVVNKKGSVSRVYLPPDANCLLSTTDHILKSRDYVNLVVASKNEMLQWLDMEAASKHCKLGASVWAWAGNESGRQPDLILASAGDVPTLETVAAAWLLQREARELRVRVVNVVDLFRLMSHHDHPHGLSPGSFAELFTEDKPVIFAFHGYPGLIHELIYHQPNPGRFHVHGYIEEGRTTTPFDMLVLNNASRYHLAINALRRSELPSSRVTRLSELFQSKLDEHVRYIREFGKDMPEVSEWQWTPPMEKAA
ncbi:MAG: phosphoketolase family protein [Actinobacteria bacterium]|nr:MAG: phosphoketolase family protein [Actinomycetota bacterium]